MIGLCNNRSLSWQLKSNELPFIEKKYFLGGWLDNCGRGLIKKVILWSCM